MHATTTLEFVEACCVFAAGFLMIVAALMLDGRDRRREHRQQKVIRRRLDERLSHYEPHRVELPLAAEADTRRRP